MAATTGVFLCVLGLAVISSTVGGPIDRESDLKRLAKELLQLNEHSREATEEGDEPEDLDTRELDNEGEEDEFDTRKEDRYARQEEDDEEEERRLHEREEDEDDEGNDDDEERRYAREFDIREQEYPEDRESNVREIEDPDEREFDVHQEEDPDEEELDARELEDNY